MLCICPKKFLLAVSLLAGQMTLYRYNSKGVKKESIHSLIQAQAQAQSLEYAETNVCPRECRRMRAFV